MRWYNVVCNLHWHLEDEIAETYEKGIEDVVFRGFDYSIIPTIFLLKFHIFIENTGFLITHLETNLSNYLSDMVKFNEINQIIAKDVPLESFNF